MIQDVLITIISLSFGFLLIPQLLNVRAGTHMNIYTSTFTCIGLSAMNVIYLSLGLYLAAIPTASIVWGLMVFYEARNSNLLTNIKYKYGLKYTI